MIDPTDAEVEAREHAGAMGGEYLDQLGKTDLAVLTLEEWRTFVGAVCGGFTEKLLEIAERHREIAQQACAKVTTDDLPY
jgi:hypothetical protein